MEQKEISHSDLDIATVEPKDEAVPPLLGRDANSMLNIVTVEPKGEPVFTEYDATFHPFVTQPNNVYSKLNIATSQPTYETIEPDYDETILTIITQPSDADSQFNIETGERKKEQTLPESILLKETQPTVRNAHSKLIITTAEPKNETGLPEYSLSIVAQLSGKDDDSKSIIATAEAKEKPGLPEYNLSSVIQPTGNDADSKLSVSTAAPKAEKALPEYNLSSVTQLKRRVADSKLNISMAEDQPEYNATILQIVTRPSDAHIKLNIATAEQKHELALPEYNASSNLPIVTQPIGRNAKSKINVATKELKNEPTLPEYNATVLPIVTQPTGKDANNGWAKSPIMFTGPPGMEQLSTVDRIIIRQRVEIYEIANNLRRNVYSFLDDHGHELYVAEEIDENVLIRVIANSYRPFKMVIFDNNHKGIISLEKAGECSGCCYLNSLKIYSPPGMLIGIVKQRYTLCKQRFLIEDEYGEVVLTIRFPLMPMPLFGNINARIYDKNDNIELGVITRQFNILSSILYTGDKYAVLFSRDLSVELKTMILCACILIDFVHFEDSGRF